MRRTMTAALAGLLATMAFAQSPPQAATTDTAVASPTIPGLVEVETYDGLSLRFDEPMLTWNERAEGAPIHVEPALPCRWMWADDTELECRGREVDAAMRKATAYRITIGPGLFSQAGAPLPPTQRTVETDRPRLSFEDFDWRGARGDVIVDSAEALDFDSVRRVLHATLDGKPVALQVVAEPVTQGNRWRAPKGQYRLTFPDLGARAGVLEVHVRPGLRSTEGPLPGAQDHVLARLRVNAPFELIETSCSAWGDAVPDATGKDLFALSDCRPEEAVTLTLTQCLDEPSLTALRAQLAGDWELTQGHRWVYSDHRWDEDTTAQRMASPPACTLALRTQTPAQSLVFRLPKGATAVHGDTFARTTAVAIGVGDAVAAAGVAPTVLRQGAGGAALPRIHTRNLDADPEINAMALGERATRSEARIPRAKTPNAIETQPAPAPDDTVRDSGGLVFAGATSHFALAYALVYAPFDVAVRESGDGQPALVWAGRWGDGAALADAEVELVDIDGSGGMVVHGRARTDADGVAWLPAAKAGTSAGLLRVVRVTHGGQRTLTPLAKGKLPMPGNGQDDDYRWDSSVDEDAMAFGVSDRLLYRPGETVNYRLWLRRRDGNHLRQRDDARAPVTLALTDLWDDKEYSRWEATPDALGSVAGKLVLPDRLVDGFLCVREVDADQSGIHGACFRIARFEAQPMWMQLEADRTAVLAGEQLALEAQGGFFSGGPAPGAQVEFYGLLMPQYFGAAYPQFAEYSFIDPYRGDSTYGADPLRGVTAPSTLDKQGRATLRWRVPDTFVDQSNLSDDAPPPIPFGRLEISAAAAVSGRSSASSAPVALGYARFPRYVGAKSDLWWWPLDRDLALETVVVTHAGVAVPGVPVQARLEHAPYDSDEDVPPADAKVVGTCTLVSGRATPCSLRPPKEGRYRVVLTADGAAPAELVRWAGGSAPDKGEDAERPSASLTLVAAADAGPATVRLVQPYARAVVLFTVEYDHVLHHWVQVVEGPSTQLEVPLELEWAPAVSLRALVRRADAAASMREAFTTPTLGASLNLDVPRRRVDAFEVTIEPPKAAPGQTLVVRLRNLSGDDHHATVSVVDDSVFQQGAEMRDGIDPASPNWLGVLGTWDVGDWYGLEAFTGVGNLFYSSPSQAQQRRANRRAARRHGRAAPDVDEETSELDSVVVTGSLIPQAAKYARSPKTEPRTRLASGRPGKPLARVRDDFLDTAYWNPDMVVPGGATRELRIPLPDNLTRWRVLVWASDAGDGFALTETTVESTLPVEVRLEAPDRVFVGDRATGTAQARNHGGSAAGVTLALTADGAGVASTGGAQALTARDAELAGTVALAPTETGDVQLVARAESMHGSDAMSTAIAVHSPWVHERESQIGWIDAAPLSLPLPTLPAGASNAQLELAVFRGTDAWRATWLRDLRDYPHRCWEQMLSRAVGAALSAAEGDAGVAWPEAKALVASTLANAPSFQDDSGRFHYFLPADGGYRDQGNKLLSAYTLRAFDLLRGLGHAVPEEVYDDLAKAVREDAARTPGAKMQRYEVARLWEEAAIATGAVAGDRRVDDAQLERLWAQWDALSWYARTELVRALARAPAPLPQAKEGVVRLRAAGKPRGLRRVLGDERDYTWAMGSNLRSQCAVVDVLHSIDTDPAGAGDRNALLRGVRDLYAGTTASLDTQSSVTCLLAMHAASARELGTNSAALPVQVSLDAQATTLTVAPGADQAVWQAPTPIAAGQALALRGPAAVDPTLNYEAVVDYDVDAMQAIPQAVGMRLSRRYEVLRDGKWAPLPATGVQAGDWVRVGLRLDVPAWRNFVAITDPVPGGLVTRDITLAGVGDVQLRNVGDPGSWWFDTRQTGATEMRLYAERVPAGEHEVFYFAQAVHAGDFLAPPAVAELMYGRGSRATTKAERVRVVKP